MHLCIQRMIPHKGGLPHSDTQGSTPARGFPWIFAACHVLHRLLAPRHPPDALLLLIPTRAPTGTRIIQAPPCTETIHRLRGKQSQATAKPSLSTHSKNALNAMTWSALGTRRRLRSPQHPGQTPRPTRHGPLLSVPPNRSRDQAKPTEPSRTSKTHQNLIHNPQRTTRFRPQAPNPAQRR